jgi:hypothetical protein
LVFMDLTLSLLAPHWFFGGHARRSCVFRSLRLIRSFVCSRCPLNTSRASHASVTCPEVGVQRTSWRWRALGNVAHVVCSSGRRAITSSTLSQRGLRCVASRDSFRHSECQSKRTFRSSRSFKRHDGCAKAAGSSSRILPECNSLDASALLPPARHVARGLTCDTPPGPTTWAQADCMGLRRLGAYSQTVPITQAAVIANDVE